MLCATELQGADGQVLRHEPCEVRCRDTQRQATSPQHGDRCGVDGHLRPCVHVHPQRLEHQRPDHLGMGDHARARVCGRQPVRDEPLDACAKRGDCFSAGRTTRAASRIESAPGCVMLQRVETTARPLTKIELVGVHIDLDGHPKCARQDVRRLQRAMLWAADDPLNPHAGQDFRKP